MSTFILRAGKDEGGEVEKLLADLRPDERNPPPRKRKQPKWLLPDYTVEGKRHSDDMAQLALIPESTEPETSGSEYIPSTEPESESIPECEECGQKECVCVSIPDSEFSSSMGEYESDDDESLLSGGECSGCGEDEEECQCSDY